MVEGRQTRLFLSADGREGDLRSEVVRHGVDGRTELQEHPERGELPLKRHGLQVALLATFDAVGVEVTPGEVVQVVEVVLFAPLDERSQPVAVGLECLVGNLPAPVVEVEFQRGVRRQRVEVVAHAATPPSSTGLPRTLIGALPLLSTMSTGREIRLIEEDDGGWSAIDEELNIASQGETREEALANLDEAVELTKEARDADTDAPEPDAPWFEG